jgi:hypothetical protein
MVDLSDFHPLIQQALRTGKIPAPDVIARALGEGIDGEVRIRGQIERESASSNSDEAASTDEQRFRDRYHEMVATMIADWHDDNPEAGNSIPKDERERIEDHCHRQIQHAWRIHRQQLQKD